MTRIVFAIPGELETPTGGFVYARNILPALSRTMDIDVCALPASYPFPTPADIDVSRRALTDAMSADAILLIDGLALGAFDAEMLDGLEARFVALVHHPLGLEEGLTTAQKDAFLASERAALGKAQHVIVTSRATASTIRELFQVSGDKITVAEPGVLRGKRATLNGEPPHLVCVGAITPRKGFATLVDALNAVIDLPWRATFTGALHRSPQTAQALREQIARYGLDSRIVITGPLNETELSALYTTGDMFALASRYEGYGMAFAEAMAHGLPAVASGEGAVRDTVPDAAGIYVETLEAVDFAAALRTLLTDPEVRRQKAEGAWQHAQALPSWDETASVVARVLKAVS